LKECSLVSLAAGTNNLISILPPCSNPYPRMLTMHIHKLTGKGNQSLQKA